MTQEQMKLVRSVLGVPWLARGRDPATGWDCWGLCQHMGKALFGLEFPDFGSLYNPDQARSGPAVSGVIDGQIGGFERCEPRAGAVALLRIIGLPCHVGLCIGDGQMLHVMQGCATVQASLLDRPWSARLVGTFAKRVSE